MTDAAYVALALVPGVGTVRFERLLQEFGAAEAVLRASPGQLQRVNGISTATATAIRHATPTDGARVLEQVAPRGGVALDPRDVGFPAALHLIPHRPPLLFAKGRMDLLQAPCVAIVGSRDHSRYGARAATHLAAGLVGEGLTVVSGMARGLDAVAHRAALDAGGGTVGVLGNGLGVVYPAANRALYDRVVSDGCLLTEFPPGERPSAGSFPRRNRLISGLARVTIVIEAGEGSGALITADAALAQGREVMAVPGPITSGVSAGTNRLIQMGAKPVLRLGDVL
jgi:DNA processing protein